jgi:hypothetical protein
MASDTRGSAVAIGVRKSPVSRPATPTVKSDGKLSLSSNCLLWPTESASKIRLDPSKIAKAISYGLSPITGEPMDAETRNEFMALLKKSWPDWFKNVIVTGLLQKHQVAVKILDGNDATMKKLGSGRFGTVYESDIIGVPVAIKKVPHAKNDKGNDSGHSECYILNTLREKLLVPRKTSGIIWLYQYLPGKDHDLAIMERAKESLWARLVKGQVSLNYIKSVVFQVLHALAMIHAEIPSFRHNDLKVDNVLLTDAVPTIVYGGQLSSVAAAERCTAKIADFDFACADFVKNPKVGTSFSLKFGCDATQNHFYDAHIFLNSMYRHADTLPTEMVDWIKKQVPKSLLGDSGAHLSYGRLIQPDKHKKKLKTATELINDPFFGVN